MSIDFDRNRVQVSFEAFVGAASPEELISRKDGFKSHVLSQQEVQQLSNDISQDAIDFEYSARDCAPQPLKLSIHSGGIEHPCRCR